MERLNTCDFCSQAFNTTDRKPYGLYPCFHNACEPCTKKLKESGSNKCNLHKQPTEIKDYMVNTSIYEKLKSNFGIIIHCGQHKDKAAEFFDIEKKTFICNHCAIMTMKRENLISQDQEIYLKQGELICKYANELEKKLQDIKDLGNGMLNRTVSYSGNEIYEKIVDAIKCFLKFDINVDLEIFSVYSGQGIRLSDQIMLLANGQSLKLKGKEKDISVICKGNASYITKLQEWVDKSYEWVCLLYRGTLHGFEAKAFHKKCDNKGPTLTIVQTIDNYIFGGFTAASWYTSAQGNVFVKDQEAFIFSLTHSSKHPVKIAETRNSLVQAKDCLPAFGAGADLCIFENCNTTADSFSRFGDTYELPTGITQNTEESRSYLAGKHNFQVKEIEIFQLRKR